VYQNVLDHIGLLEIPEIISSAKQGRVDLNQEQGRAVVYFWSLKSSAFEKSTVVPTSSPAAIDANQAPLPASRHCA
jgi:hypothetical protein